MCFKRVPVFLLACLFCLSAARSQNLPNNQVSIASPTAASLGKYADIPVNYHTGIPQVGIPIYSIKEGSLQLPIALSYHASGLKVMEPASWVGAGWSLNAGGVITRTVQGAPDEKGTSGATSNQLFGYLSDGGFPNYLWYQNPSDVNNTPQFLKDMASGQADGEPDLFFFNFNGYTGKFYFGDDKVAVTLPHQDLKIDYFYTPSLFKSIESFIITTPDGTKYYFGYTPETNDTDPVERTIAFNANGYGNEGRSISSWYLNKIESFDGTHTITLSYAAERYSYFNIGMSTLPLEDNNSSHLLLNKVYVEGVRLSQIKFANGTIDFVPGNLRTDLSGFLPRWQLGDDANVEAYTLSEIKIKDLNNTACKKFVLSYDYFVDNVTPESSLFGAAGITSDKRRLKLLQVQEQSCDGTAVIPPHVFTYNSGLVPRKISYAQDHWGYYNGANNTTGLIPTYTDNKYYTISGANRDAHWPEMAGGALERITYPTGGYIDFEFEPHSTWVNYNIYVSTLRFSLSAGFDGSSTAGSPTPITLSGNAYKLHLTNVNGADLAEATIYNSSNQQVGFISAAGGRVADLLLTLAAGSYTVSFVQHDNLTNNGAELSFTEMVPTNVSKNETVGGLRIKTMNHTDDLAAGVITTNYSYLDANNHSTGILYSRPTYVQTLKNNGQRYIYQFLLMSGATIYRDYETSNVGEEPYFSIGNRKAIKSAAPILPMNNTQGNHIGYGEVKVSQTNNGYSIYRYYGSDTWDSNQSDVCVRTIESSASLPDAPQYPAAPLPFEYKRGELKYEGHFRNDGKILKEASYYPVYNDQPITTPGVRVYTEKRSESPLLIIAAKTDFELHSYKKTEQTTIETVYDEFSSNAITTTKTTLFESPNHSQATSLKSFNSKGEELLEKMKYSFDFILSSCTPSTNCWTDYQNSLMAYQNQFNTEYNGCADQNCRDLAKSNYNAHKMEARRNYSNCRMQNASAYASCLQNAKTTADVALKPVIELQQRFIVTPLESSSWKNGNLLQASFNKFDYSSDPIPNVYVAKNQLVNPSTLATVFTNSAVSSTTLAKDSRYVDEASLKFSYGNPVEVIKKDGLVTTYIWGYKNDSYPLAKIVGVSHSAILSSAGLVTSVLQNPANDQALRTELAKIRQAFPSALVNTYTYSPIFGMTSETDANGRTTYYQYDALGRLQVVKDKDGNIIKTVEYHYKN